MKSNPSPKDRAQNLAIAYSVKRRNKMSQGGNVKLQEAQKENKGPEHYSDAPDTTGCPVCGQMDCAMHEGGQLEMRPEPPKDPMYMYEGGQLDDQRSPLDSPDEQLPTMPQYDDTLSPKMEVAPKMSMLKHDEHGLKSEQLHEAAMAKRKLMHAKALHMAEGGQVKGIEEDSSPGKEPNEWITAPSNDFMKHPDESEVDDAEHDAGVVDEMMDESLAGQALRKRRARRL